MSVGLLWSLTTSPIKRLKFRFTQSGIRLVPTILLIFMEARVKFPTPGHLMNVKSPPPPLGKFFHKFTYLSFAHGEKTRKQREKAVEFLCVSVGVIPRFSRPSKMAAMPTSHAKFPTHVPRGSAQVSKSPPWLFCLARSPNLSVFQVCFHRSQSGL